MAWADTVREGDPVDRARVELDGNLIACKRRRHADIPQVARPLTASVVVVDRRSSIYCSVGQSGMPEQRDFAGVACDI